MSTKIEVDDELLIKATEALGTPTKKATVEEALRQIVRDHEARKAIADLRGIGWEGDLEELKRMRQGRNFDHIK
jgi:Arc/MetJ family transcription regulator